MSIPGSSFLPILHHCVLSPFSNTGATCLETLPCTLYPLSFSCSPGNPQPVPSKIKFPYYLEQPLSYWPQRCRPLSVQMLLCVATDTEGQSFVVISAMYVGLHSHSGHFSLLLLAFPSLTLYENWTVLPYTLPSSVVQAPFPACFPLLVLLLQCPYPFLTVSPTFLP